MGIPSPCPSLALFLLPVGRTREDTVRKIVAGLTGDAEGSDLANELSKADPVTLENGQESDDDISEPGDWVPDPVDADPG